jgi:hypothetical protein
MPSKEGIPNLQMISLKKQLLRCPEDARQRMNNFLQTFYAQSMVIQGHLAALQGRERREISLNLIRMTLEDCQQLSDEIGELQSLVESTLGSGSPLKGA